MVNSVVISERLVQSANLIPTYTTIPIETAVLEAASTISPLEVQNVAGTGNQTGEQKDFETYSHIELPNSLSRNATVGHTLVDIESDVQSPTIPKCLVNAFF